MTLQLGSAAKFVVASVCTERTCHHASHSYRSRRDSGFAGSAPTAHPGLRNGQRNARHNSLDESSLIQLKPNINLIRLFRIQFCQWAESSCSRHEFLCQRPARSLKPLWVLYRLVLQPVDELVTHPLP